MSKTYEQLAASFEEVISDLDKTGGKNLKRTTLTLHIEPIKKYDSTAVKRIRTNNNLTQNLLAKYIGVSKKTVEAWESGRNTPNGPSSRLLEMLDTNNISLVY